MQVEEVAERYRSHILGRNPLLASSMGVHEYDGIWPDVSRKGVEDDISLIRRIIDEAEQAEDSPDKELFLWYLDIGLYELETLQFWRHSPNAAGTILSGLTVLLRRQFPDEEKRMASLRERMATAHQILLQVMERVDMPVKLWTESEVRAVRSLRNFLGDLYDTLSEQSEKLLSVLSEYERWLQSQETMDELPLDGERFRVLIEKRRLGMTLEEIRSLGREYLAQTGKELEELVEKLGGRSVEEIRERIRSKHPTTYEEALRGYRELADRARRFLIENDLITMPKERLEVIFSYPYMRQFLSIAAAGMPARYDPEQIGYFYLTPHDDQKMLKEHSFAFQPLLISHESYPGHHLHGACKNTHPSVIRSGIYSTLSANTAIMYSCKLGDITEGWGLYCERMMYDNGFENDPENPDIEQKFLQVNALRWRATRVLIDIGLHTGEMGYEEAVSYLVRNTGYNETTAHSEVQMYSRSPGYFMSYLLGSHMMSEFRKTSGLPLKDFHDSVVYAGSVPLWFLRDHILSLRNSMQ